MIILGIETSCDDTGVAIIKATPQKGGVKFAILSNIVSSQIKVHQKYGGVVPNLAAREHLKNIEPCLKAAFKKSNVKIKDIDLIAVTIGPGLIPSLLIGVHLAKTLAYRWQKPIIGVNHIEAHVIAAIAAINPKFQILNPKHFPAIALVVSGGHTQLILVKKIGEYKIIGETRDDAAGECFDKVAKLLGLGYPGGPEIAAQAAQILNPKSENLNKSQILNFKLPRPMINHKNYDFSFSGLKTAVLYLVKNTKDTMKDTWYPKNVGYQVSYIPVLCRETQQAIIDVLIEKTIRAAREYKAKTIILSGGVASNQELRKQLATAVKKNIHNSLFMIPNSNLCTDNGAMIAMAGYFNKEKATKKYDKVKADANSRLS